jgi:DNA-binding CsgD family transcriptional regulator
VDVWRARLTEREREILALVAARNADKEIAARLGIRERTVRFHLSECRRRLGAVSRAQVIATAIESGEIGPTGGTARSVEK